MKSQVSEQHWNWSGLKQPAFFVFIKKKKTPENIYFDIKVDSIVKYKILSI